MHIRPMRLADVRAAAALERTVFGSEAWPASTFAHVCHLFRTPGPARGRLWVAETGSGRLVGYGGMELSVLGGEADLVNLAVDPVFRRRGVGRRLVEAAIRFARQRRISLLWLRVRPSDGPARTLYERCGFEVVGRHRGYYERPAESAILMARPEGA